MTEWFRKSGTARALCVATGRFWPSEAKLNASIWKQTRCILRKMFRSIVPPSEFDGQVKLHLSALRRRSHSAVIGAGDAGIGAAPTDEVERVVDVHAELRVDPFLDWKRLAQRNR